MNIQQLKYIVAVNRFRSFAKAADACHVSQPTLSAMILKLEEELEVRLFDRTNKSVAPTILGEKIIALAELVLRDMDRIGELVDEEKGAIGGSFSLSVGPTIAPYILPKFIQRYRRNYPEVQLTIREMKVNFMLEALLKEELDVGIAIAGNRRSGVFEIPLYSEQFLIYLSGKDENTEEPFNPADLKIENMWIMKDAQCMRDSAFSFCKGRDKGHHVYESGSIDTLVHVVDENGGFTLIPELHLPFLSEQQKSNVRPIQGDYLSQRSVSLYIREDYVRERMLNTITDTLQLFLPQRMFNERIQKYGIKL